MSNVEIISDKSFSDVDNEILDRFVEFQQALIDKDDVKLNDILTEKYELIHMSGKKQTKSEFISEIMDGTLNYYKSEIIDPTILWDDDERPTLIADVTLTAKVYGIDGKWTLDTTVDFEKSMVNGIFPSGIIDLLFQTVFSFKNSKAPPKMKDIAIIIIVSFDQMLMDLLWGKLLLLMIRRNSTLDSLPVFRIT